MIAVQQAGKPASRFYEVVHRIADRFSPAVAQAFLNAVAKLVVRIDDVALASGIAAMDLAQINAAIGAERLADLLAQDPALRDALYRTAVETGRAGANVLEDTAGIAFRFNSADPNIVLFARTQVAELVVAVGDDVKEAIRLVVALGSEYGITPVQQARAIRQVVGLPPNWAEAPLNLAAELRAGRFTDTRRMSAVDKAQIRSRLAKGTVNEAFIDRMQVKYANSLRNRRALNIARTETARAANHGQNEGWKQATRAGVLPKSARRVWIVTPDDRLRETHRMVPIMNPDGVALDQPFQTPLGPSMGPPLEVNCRCSLGLVFPGLTGVV